MGRPRKERPEPWEETPREFRVRRERAQAVALDLLEALKALVTHPIVFVGTEDDTELASYVDVARAAIAKAEGGDEYAKAVDYGNAVMERFNRKFGGKP